MNTIIHHDFEMTPAEFVTRRVVIAKRVPDYSGEYASRPLTGMEIRDDGGANGTDHYLALTAEQPEDQFYAEATPYWHRPRATLDLCGGTTSLWLKAVTPIMVNEGYHPYLFIAHYDEPSNTFCGWYHRQTLLVGAEWTLMSCRCRMTKRAGCAIRATHTIHSPARSIQC